MDNIIAVDPEKCVACGNCVMVCSLVHEGAFSPAKSRINVVELRRQRLNVPALCVQCSEPLCMDVCPAGALSRDHATGAVVVNADVCIGCRMCTLVCPLGGVTINYETGKSIKCDLCGGDPYCVKVCGYGALSYLPLEQDGMNRRRKGVQKISAAFEKLMV